jgi:nucleotide-binding universal stress UspA family protein
MGKKILVATDFSELGRAAVTAALELARASNASVDVLHVFTMRAQPDASGYTAKQMQQHEANARADLSRAADEVAATGLLGESLLRVGPAAETVLLAADERAADLIVIGSHGRSGLARLVLGSTAENVLRRAKVPVLIVKEAQPAPTRVIGVAVDLGIESGHAVATGFELGQALGARVHLIHAYAAVVVPNEFGAGSIPHERLHDRARESVLDLAAPYQRLPAMGKCVVELGDPITVILELAEDLDLDLLVLGTEGRHGLSRMVVGSVAESVLRQTRVPVLIAKHRRAPAEL